MTRRPATRSSRALLALLAGALLTPRTAVAAFEFVEPTWDSASRFLSLARSELGQDRVVLGAQLDWSQLRPEDGVLILHPGTVPSFTEARAFLSGGGRFAVLDDFGRGDELLRSFHVRRVAPPAGVPTHSNNPNLRIAVASIEPAAYGALRHPIVRDVEFVVTNHAQALVPDPSIKLTPVLEFQGPKDTYPLALTGVIGDARGCGLDAQGSRPRKGARCGRLFAMGDPSVFIDLMMQFEGNRELARGLIRYLVEDDVWGQRSGRLFVLANTFEERGSFGGSGDLRRAVEGATDRARTWLESAEENGLPRRWSTAAAIALGAVLLLWSYQSSGQVYRKTKPRFARPTPLVAQGGIPGKAAVLSAESTRAALIIAELKTTCEHYLRAHLGLEPKDSTRTILETIQRRGALDVAAQKRLNEQFEVMAAAEATLLGRAGEVPPYVKVNEQAIVAMHKALEELLPQVRGTRHE